MPIKNQIIDKTDEEEKDISKRINDIVNNVNNSKIKMNSIIKELKSQLASDEDDADLTDLRIKKNLFDAMIKKYQRTLERFGDAESEVKRIKETKLVRGAEIALGRELDEQERKNAVENPEMVKQIYQEKLAPGILINAVRDLEERHKDIKKLEKSILELHNMIIELNALVQYQGEMIDNIVNNVSIAKDHVINAEIEFELGKKKMERKKKIKCIIMIAIIAGLLIIILPILIKFL